mgnify:CR=1 FL=1
MKLNELIETLQLIAEETNASGHKFIENGGDVNILIDDPLIDIDFVISDVEADRAICGCWMGCNIILKSKKS